MFSIGIVQDVLEAHALRRGSHRIRVEFDRVQQFGQIAMHGRTCQHDVSVAVDFGMVLAPFSGRVDRARENHTVATSV